MIRLLNMNSELKCFLESSRILVLKTRSMHAKHVLYIRTLVRTLHAGIKNANPPIKSQFRLLRKNLDSFIRVSTVAFI